jgi:hypothetical protein
MTKMHFFKECLLKKENIFRLKKIKSIAYRNEDSFVVVVVVVVITRLRNNRTC